jgi:hypothetical protein
VGCGSTLLEVSGTLEVFPRRTILIPASLLLPEAIPIRATLQIGVNGPLEAGEVELVVAKWVSGRPVREWNPWRSVFLFVMAGILSVYQRQCNMFSCA